MRDNGYTGRDKSLHYAMFDSSADFADACDMPSARRFISKIAERYNESWSGGTAEQALAFARHGDMTYVSEAERLVEKIDAEIDSEGMRPVWEPSVVGHFPLVPAYLAGTPEAMLARTDVPDARGDLELWVEMGCSASVQQSDMRRRGVCVLAAAMALSRIRNVRITCFTAFRYNNMTVPLRFPMDVSEVCGMITQTSVTRLLMYGYSDSVTGDDTGIPWARWGVHSGDPESYRAMLTKHAGMPADAELLTMHKLGVMSRISDDELVEILNRKLREVAGKEDGEN